MLDRLDMTPITYNNNNTIKNMIYLELCEHERNFLIDFIKRVMFKDIIVKKNKTKAY